MTIFVHLAIPHPVTKYVGTVYTPSMFVATACSRSWSDENRPKRTLLLPLVTCAECLRSSAAGTSWLQAPLSESEGSSK